MYSYSMPARAARTHLHRGAAPCDQRCAPRGAGRARGPAGRATTTASMAEPGPVPTLADMLAAKREDDHRAAERAKKLDEEFPAVGPPDDTAGGRGGAVADEDEDEDATAALDIDGGDDEDETIEACEVWSNCYHPPVTEREPVGGPSWVGVERARARLRGLYEKRCGMVAAALRGRGMRKPSEMDVAMLLADEEERAEVLAPLDLEDMRAEYSFLRRAAGVDGRLMRGDLTPAAIVALVEWTEERAHKRRRGRAEEERVFACTKVRAVKRARR